MDYRWLAAAIEQGAPPGQIADWLTDEGAGLARVLHLYAGVPPRFTAGISKDVLAAWLAAHGDARADAVARLRKPEPPVWGVGVDADWRFLGWRVLGVVACPSCPERAPPRDPWIETGLELRRAPPGGPLQPEAARSRRPLPRLRRDVVDRRGGLARDQGPEAFRAGPVRRGGDHPLRRLPAARPLPPQRPLPL